MGRFQYHALKHKIFHRCPLSGLYFRIWRKNKNNKRIAGAFRRMQPCHHQKYHQFLKKDGILSVKFGTGGTAIRCPLNEITLYRIYAALEPDFLSKLIGLHPAPSPFCPVGRNIHNLLDTSYNQVRDDLRRSLQSVTMEEIIDQYHNIQQALP